MHRHGKSHESLREADGRRARQREGRLGDRLRSPRSERRGQDDDDQAAHGPDRHDGGRGVGRGIRRPSGSDAREAADRLGRLRGHPRRRLHGVGEPLAPGEAAEPPGVERARGGPPDVLWTQRPTQGSGEDLFHGHAQEARDRVGVVASTGGRVHGRTDDRPRREHAADALGPHHRRQQGIRDHRLADEPLHRGSGGRRARLPQILRDDEEGATISTETKHIRVSTPQTESARRSVSQRSQFFGLYAREVLRTFRNPWVLVITFVQPFMWLAFFGSSFSGASPALVQQIFHTSSYIAFLLPGVLATSMLTVGMFGSMSTIQDKRFGFMKRILLTPTTKATVYLSKVLGSTTRGLVQIPVMIAAAALFGVSFAGNPLMWAGWILGIFLLGLGMSCFFLAVTASSTDWQTPGVISNFITMPLMFASGALLPLANFPSWMQAIASVNPVSFSALLGRGIVVFGTVDWSYLGYLTLFAVGMLVVGTAVASRYLKAE